MNLSYEYEGKDIPTLTDQEIGALEKMKEKKEG